MLRQIGLVRQPIPNGFADNYHSHAKHLPALRNLPSHKDVLS